MKRLRSILICLALLAGTGVVPAKGALNQSQGKVAAGSLQSVLRAF